jgi:hypothetical protein
VTPSDGLQVDDVLLYMNEELWLAGVVRIRDESFQLSLFRTSVEGEWVVELDLGRRLLVRGRSCVDVPDGAVPSALPVGGRIFQQYRHGSGRAETAGLYVPLVEPAGRFWLLSAAGGHHLVVADSGAARIAVTGEELHPGLVDRLPSRRG